MSVRDARVYTCTVYDKLSFTRLRNYTIGASLLSVSVSVSVPWNSSFTEHKPDLFLLQEQWLTPANLYLFDTHSASYFSVGSSAMSKCVGLGMLRGRPFGGTIVLIKKTYVKSLIVLCTVMNDMLLQR